MELLKLEEIQTHEQAVAILLATAVQTLDHLRETMGTDNLPQGAEIIQKSIDIIKGEQNASS